MTRTRSALVVCATLVLLGSAAQAHGPTIQLSFSGARPPQLAVPQGTTVHFHNANTSGDTITVVLEGAREESSAPLGRAEGWHVTFETTGLVSFHVKELPKVAGKIVVAEE